MSEARKKKVVKKKISPYPLEAEMLEGAAKVVLSVHFLSPKGLVADVVSGICYVGRHYRCLVRLPGSVVPVATDGQVFKTHDGLDSKTGKVRRTVEVLFLKTPEAERGRIKDFLSNAGQKE